MSAGLVDDPARYRWSGHREIIGKDKLGFSDVDEVLTMFGMSRRAARAAYVKGLNVAGSAVWIGEEPSKLPWWRFANDDAVPPREGGVYVDYLGRSTAPERPRMPVEEFLDRACGVVGVDVDELASRSREPRLRELREMVAVIGVEKYGQRVRELAERMRKNPGSVSRWVTNAAERRLVDSSFGERLRHLDEALATNA